MLLHGMKTHRTLTEILLLHKLHCETKDWEKKMYVTICQYERRDEIYISYMQLGGLSFGEHV